MNPAPEKPIIALTMGDAAGVGPEVIARAWATKAVHDDCRPFVIGHPEVMRRAVQLVGGQESVLEIDSPSEVPRTVAASDQGASIPCLRVGRDDVIDLPAGAADARAGQAAYDAITSAVDLALAGHVDAIVTAPICKQALHLAGHAYPGHTELLAEQCGADAFAMMLYLPPGAGVRGPAGLGVVHVTLHIALRGVFGQLSSVAVAEKCRLADQAMRSFGVQAPRIGVCALNPHAGEGGLFGDEEQTAIGPAVEQMRARGFNVTGPLAADALFPSAREGAFDAIVVMYHDQGHVGMKLLGRNTAVNVTLGLPIVRTSVAHGTAFDIAWRGQADAEGMVAAVITAARLAV